ncbi:MAG: translation initiation factor IF-2 [Methylomonas sp.]|nr:translation initiation factor IF-2 [Methylomonas sp.]PPD21428.1 MAG: translation initiation factor IF-2 [Methylomonas sp.]PPD25086.1 MAG: translation initiation factor IF-2 [Methylomonas sp.]PPD34560.1 MAG: translation initiation factor IF-2 [Methylomonas sp.]PPD41447.1 MAG: translation initiation factor IF-2 [Methylomonas sp.]
MSDKTVKELASAVNTPLDRFLEQLKDAGLDARHPDDIITEDEKGKLLAHLRRLHGKSDTDQQIGAPKRITLKRSTRTELKVQTAPGTAAKTVSVEVRKQKTYIKRSEAPSSDELKETERAKQAAEAVEASRQKQVVTAETSLPPAETKTEESGKTFESDTAKPLADTTPEPERAAKTPADVQTETVAKQEPSKPEAPELTAEQLEEIEKKRRLEAAVEKNAEKVRQAAAAKQQTLHKKKPEFKPSRPAAPTAGADAGDGARRSGPPPGKGKKKQASRREKPEFEIELQARHKFEKPALPTKMDVTIPETIVVSDLAAKMNVKAAEVIKQLMKLGIMTTINQPIDQETAVILVEEMGHTPIMQSEDDFEQEMLAEALGEADQRKLLARAPIVTIMGHVDHGKTSLLDYIRKTRVAAGEAGGITQHIGAYQVKTDHGSVTFLDTPGHAAFTAMRARGAEVTDIVIVVVAADDGVMPQTKEAIEHARAANVPMIVALNKIDKPEANPDRVMQELATLNVVPEEWGGDVQFLKVSAKTGTGIDDLIEALIVLAEVLELKAPKDGTAQGVCIESRLDKGRGAVATILVQKGSLNKGDFVLCGHEYGRIRAMFDENAHSIKLAGPSTPVEILGLSGTPNAGDEFLVVQNERVARELAAHREDRKKSSRHAAMGASKLDDVFSRMTAGETSTLNVVIKTDVQGSLEALRESLVNLSTDEVQVKCIYGGVGGINEGDANLALASSAILIGFNVRADAVARKLIEEKDIDLHYYSIIYEAIDEVKRAISGMLAPDIQEKIVGLAEVRDVFRSPKFGAIAGCMVIDGFVKRNLPIRVLRNNVVIFEGQLESLRRFKDDVNEVKMGMECGIGVKNYNDVKTGDQIEVFERIEVKREI